MALLRLQRKRLPRVQKLQELLPGLVHFQPELLQLLGHFLQKLLNELYVFLLLLCLVDLWVQTNNFSL
ncbi:hypothetical protein D3C87_1976860 [compost metagenome]